MTSIPTYRLSWIRSATAVACAVALVSGCGKSITISDSGSGQPSALPPTSSAAVPESAAADNSGALQVVDSAAADNGKTGNGGTVTGVAIQETPPKWVQLSAVTSPPLNAPHLININQAALYRFDNDVAKPSTSNCYDACAIKWPPVTIEEGGSVYLAGVNPKKVGAIRRKNGDVQLTVGGWPVYRFSGDSKPGDLNGQGVGRTWFAVGPDGAKLSTSSAARRALRI